MQNKNEIEIVEIFSFSAVLLGKNAYLCHSLTNF